MTATERTWPPPSTWFSFHCEDDDRVPGDPPLAVSPQGRVSGTVEVGPLQGLRLTEPFVVAQWTVDQVRTSDGKVVSVGTVDAMTQNQDTRQWRREGAVAVCNIGYYAPDRVSLAGALVPDAEQELIDELAAGRVLVRIEPRYSDQLPVLGGVEVYRPLRPAPPPAPPPVRQVWS